MRDSRRAGQISRDVRHGVNNSFREPDYCGSVTIAYNALMSRSSRSSHSAAVPAAMPAPVPGFAAVPYANPAGGSAAGLDERLARLEQRLTELTFMQCLSGGPALHIACAAQFITRTHAMIFPPLRGSLAGQRVAMLASGPTLRQAPSLEGCLITACNHSYTFLRGASMILSSIFQG